MFVVISDFRHRLIKVATGPGCVYIGLCHWQLGVKVEDVVIQIFLDSIEFFYRKIDTDNYPAIIRKRIFLLFNLRVMPSDNNTDAKIV